MAGYVEARKPMFATCLGHQVLALAAGGETPNTVSTISPVSDNENRTGAGAWPH